MDILEQLEENNEKLREINDLLEAGQADPLIVAQYLPKIEETNQELIKLTEDVGSDSI
jgi:hypothetical protein